MVRITDSLSKHNVYDVIHMYNWARSYFRYLSMSTKHLIYIVLNDKIEICELYGLAGKKTNHIHDPLHLLIVFYIRCCPQFIEDGIYISFYDMIIKNKFVIHNYDELCELTKNNIIHMESDIFLNHLAHTKL